MRGGESDSQKDTLGKEMAQFSITKLSSFSTHILDLKGLGS